MEEDEEASTISERKDTNERKGLFLLIHLQHEHVEY